MGIETALIGALALSAVSAGVQAHQANKQARAQRRATEQAEQQAKRADEQSRQAQRKQESNQADVSGILVQNQNEMLSGGETLLTGAQGIDNKRLNLGKGNTLG